MKFSEFTFLVKSDLYRYAGTTGVREFINHMFFSPGFNYSFWMRICSYFRENRLFRYTLYYVFMIVFMHYTFKYGIEIPQGTKVGSGLYMPHCGGIVVNSQAVLGKNCNLSHGVTIGKTDRGSREGTAVIGDNVYIGPGAKILGRVYIGKNVAIGANAVVTKDVPDNAVAVGGPAQVISYAGAHDYVKRTDYD
jgi:serine O-acetyltransferase